MDTIPTQIEVDRQEFAKAALTGLLAGYYSKTTQYNLSEVVDESFKIADAMLTARKGGAGIEDPAELRAQRDALLHALKSSAKFIEVCREQCAVNCGHDSQFVAELQRIRAAISKCERSTP